MPPGSVGPGPGQRGLTRKEMKAVFCIDCIHWYWPIGFVPGESLCVRLGMPEAGRVPYRKPVDTKNPDGSCDYFTKVGWFHLLIRKYRVRKER